MRGALVVIEIALAVVLLSGAGLLTRSFVALQQVALGFRPQNVLVMRATVPAPIPEANKFFNDVISQIGALPGVLAAGATMAPPGHVESSGGYFLDHMPAQPDWHTARTSAGTASKSLRRQSGRVNGRTLPAIAGKGTRGTSCGEAPALRELPGTEPHWMRL